MLEGLYSSKSLYIQMFIFMKRNLHWSREIEIIRYVAILMSDRQVLKFGLFTENICLYKSTRLSLWVHVWRVRKYEQLKLSVIVGFLFKFVLLLFVIFYYFLLLIFDLYVPFLTLVRHDGR